MAFVCTSTPARCARQAIGVLGFGAGLGCLIFGAVTLQAAPRDVTAVATVGVGALLSLQSCCICLMGPCADRQMDRMIDTLQENNRSLRESLDYFERMNKEYKEQNDKAQEIVQRSEHNVEELEQRAAELEDAARKLRESLDESNKALERSRAISEQMEKDLIEVNGLKEASDHELEELRLLVVEQKDQIKKLAEQANNLNELQRESVKMIQNLALYGNKCKKFGVSLKEVSKELRETDESLGLTASEMGAQMKALKGIANALERTDRSLRTHVERRRVKKKKKTSGSSSSSTLTLRGEDLA